MKATAEKVAQVLPLLRRAVRAKVDYYNACRAIEVEVIGYDVDGLDEAIEGLAFNLNLPEEADGITEKDARETIEHVRREK